MDLWPGYVFVVQTSVTPVKLKICGWRGVSFVSFTHSISSFNRGLPALYHYALLFRHVRLKRTFFKIGHSGADNEILSRPKGPRGTRVQVQESRNLQFMCPLSQRCFIPNSKRIPP